MSDKGEKVNKFRDLLINLITEREEIEQRTQQKITERLDVKINKIQQEKANFLEGDTVMKKPSRFAQKRKEIQKEKQKSPCHTDALTDPNQGSELFVDVSKSDQTSEVDKSFINRDFNALRDNSEHTIRDLEDSLQNMNIEEGSSNQDDNVTNFTSYEIKTIKKFNKNSTNMDMKFKPNR